MKVISEQTIRSLGVTPRECVEWIKESFSIKRYAQLPAKISVHPSEDDFFTSMPCLLPPATTEIDRWKPLHHYFGIKEVHRIKGAVPSLGSDMMLYDAHTGELLALMDSDWITTMRTGAVAAVAAKCLRKSDAKTYGFIGLGNTARASLLCMLEQEPETMFFVKLLRYKDQADLFIKRFEKYGNVRFDVVDNVHELVQTSDVLLSCVTSAEGLFVEDEKEFKAGITLIPVHTRGFQNCDTAFDRVFGDDTEHVKGFRYFKQFKDYNELGEVLAGNDIGRKSDSQRILSYNYGIALHDVVYAAKIFEMVKEEKEIELKKETGKFWV